MKPTLHQGDCLDILPTLPADIFDSVVTDPPYGISFLSSDWDHGIPGPQFWKEVLRVAKPGAFMLAFGGTRTFHRLACAIEDAGWEFRDTIMWCYGSGMPKSLDVSKAIDKAAGVKRKVIGKAADFARDGAQRKTDESHMRPHEEQGGHGYGDRWSADVTAPATDEAKKWAGWGTALKPAWEPILVCRKPLEGTVVQNILKHGTGAMNIDDCRIKHVTVGNGDLAHNPHLRTHINGGNGGNILSREDERRVVIPNLVGRWPANLIHDNSPEVIEVFDKAGEHPSCNSPSDVKCESKYRPDQGSYQGQGPIYPGETGSAARFFYCAKASKDDRQEGMGEGLNKVVNNHPTVKPTRLLMYLCRLVTPEGGTILDPFMGSGSTGKAAMLDGFGFVGIEKEAEYVEIARKRVREDPFS